jgi:uncharacterized protein
MKTIILASLRANAGKTSLIVGLAEYLKRPVGYMKPFGDRLLYSKKRLWDYDAALMSNLYAIDRNPEHMSIGFDHAKIRYMFTGDGLHKQLAEMADVMGRDTDLLLVECGRSISYGSSVGLDPLAIARSLKAPLVIVASGGDEDILDDIIFLQRQVDLEGIDLAGYIINRVNAVDSFRDLYLPDIKKLGVKVLGIVPHRVELSYYSLRFLADRLFAKVLTCERNLGRIVKHIFIGAMAGDTALQKPFFRKGDKLVITGGDRTDMILAAIESNSAGILLTNNILPPANILARVEESGVPMLLANTDTNEAARRIAGLQPLLTIEDRGRIELLRELVAANVNVQALTG